MNAREDAPEVPAVAEQETRARVSPLDFLLS
jgi:hypothetical protein